MFLSLLCQAKALETLHSMHITIKSKQKYWIPLSSSSETQTSSRIWLKTPLLVQSTRESLLIILTCITYQVTGRQLPCPAFAHYILNPFPFHFTWTLIPFVPQPGKISRVHVPAHGANYQNATSKGTILNLLLSTGNTNQRWIKDLLWLETLSR